MANMHWHLPNYVHTPVESDCLQFCLSAFSFTDMTNCYWQSNNKALGQSMLEPYVWIRRHLGSEKYYN